LKPFGKSVQIFAGKRTSLMAMRKSINFADIMLQTIQNIPIGDFHYELPDGQIARYPLPERDQSKLLIYNHQYLMEDCFFNLGNYLPAGAMLVSNQTRVIQARLNFRKLGGSAIELFCLGPVDELIAFEQAFVQPSPVVWKCLVGNSKRWKEGSLTKMIQVGGKEITLSARRIKQQHDFSEIEFSWDNQELSFAHVLELAGETPLPPYLKRKAEVSDKNNYQTIFARWEGSVAAPTAGLHFTQNLVTKLKDQGFNFDQVTLHVGAGTFKPVSSHTIGQHDMHAEHIIVSRETIQALIGQQAKAVIPIGTTSMRTLESLYWIACLLRKNIDIRQIQLPQWFPYDQPDCEGFSSGEALQCLLNYLDHHSTDQLAASTSLMIAPGYRFRMTHGLITNFHQPGSTLLLLVAALVGEGWKDAYHFALANNFRFLSYGDSCLFLPKST